MQNAVGRECKDILQLTGKEVFHGNQYFDGYEFQKAGAKIQSVSHSGGSIDELLREAIKICGIKDGMTISFHHHFREMAIM